MMNRINYIDRMKGLAILVVVLAHVYLFAFGMGNSAVFRFCISFEMPLFMFVSGFVAYISGNSGGGKLQEVRQENCLVCLSSLCCKLWHGCL